MSLLLLAGVVKKRLVCFLVFLNNLFFVWKCEYKTLCKPPDFCTSMQTARHSVTLLPSCKNELLKRLLYLKNLHFSITGRFPHHFIIFVSLFRWNSTTYLKPGTRHTLIIDRVVLSKVEWQKNTEQTLFVMLFPWPWICVTTVPDTSRPTLHI